MAKIVLTDELHWVELPHDGTSPVLNTSKEVAVCHTVGTNGHPVFFKNFLSADEPGHPFTNGQLVFTADTVEFRDGSSVELAHSDDFPSEELFSQIAPVGHTVHSGGFQLADYQRPLEWRIAIVEGTPNNAIEAEIYRPDHVVIDADDRTDVAVTIDDDTDETSPAAFTITNGVSEPAGGRGGVILRWNLTDAQLLLLRPVDGDGNRVHKKIGLTIAAAASTPVLTYSAYNEHEFDVTDAEFNLRYQHSVGVQPYSSSHAVYARTTNPRGATLSTGPRS